jgi:hypothetical protein
MGNGERLLQGALALYFNLLWGQPVRSDVSVSCALLDRHRSFGGWDAIYLIFFTLFVTAEVIGGLAEGKAQEGPKDIIAAQIRSQG